MPNMGNENFPLIFGILALSFLYINYELSIKIIDYLKARGEKFNPSFMRINIFKNAQLYKQFKLQENGHIGKEYYAFIITFALFVLFVFLCAISIFIT